MSRVSMWIPCLCLLGLGLLACCGTQDIKLVDTSYGDKAMSNSILVVYGTWAGSTAEVADAIGRTLADEGARVEVKPVESVQSLAGYHSMVIGSAVRAGKVKPEVMRFVSDHASELRNIPVAFFVVCMTMKEDTPENRKTVEAYLDPIREKVNLVDTGLFAGRMDYSRLGFFARMAVKYFVKVPEGDYRDWNAIKAWARSLKPRMMIRSGPS